MLGDGLAAAAGGGVTVVRAGGGVTVTAIESVRCGIDRTGPRVTEPSATTTAVPPIRKARRTRARRGRDVTMLRAR
jgi:hypothetical protein